MSSDRRTTGGRSGGWASFLIGPAFFGLAYWFLAGPDLSQIPHTRAVVVPAEDISIEPRRQILHDPPTINLGGFERTCMDCHRHFPPREDTPKRLLQHTHIRLNHGINDRCRNCHDVEDRNRLVLYGGESISYDQVVELCEKCHGPTYEDWVRGMHGKVLGYWDEALGPVRRLVCTECHDPHTPRIPAMSPIRPLPPPSTLRMGNPQEHVYEELEELDPLRRALHLAERVSRKAAEGDGTEEEQQ